jgi:hypothetical protein
LNPTDLPLAGQMSRIADSEFHVSAYKRLSLSYKC